MNFPFIINTVCFNFSMSFNKTDTDFVYILNVGQEKGWCAMRENYNKAKLKEIYIS